MTAPMSNGSSMPPPQPESPAAAEQSAASSATTFETFGFVDLQVNGFAGVDFNDPACTTDDVSRAIAAMRKTGVTRCLPTLITSSVDVFMRCAATLSRHADTDPEAAIAGIHMEGPYISPADGFRGAHPLADVRDASIDDFKRRQDAANGRIRLVTLAPEVPGAIALIEHLVAQDIRVALGHTNATSDDIRAAVSAGATLSTHLGNGCAMTLPRHPNIIWDQLADDRLLASFIVDGHHVPAATVKAMMRAKSSSRCVLVTDAIAAAGCPPGEYRLGGLTVVLNAAGRVSPPGAAHLAGSALSMDAAIGHTVRFTGLPLDDVLAMASTNPARYLGIEPAGRLEATWDAQTYTLRVRLLPKDSAPPSPPEAPGSWGGVGV
jgi:N-acetylglucosamine-6-phosphate deacetylase